MSKYESGVCVSALATVCCMAKLTISTFLRYKEMIKESDVVKGMTLIINQKPQMLQDDEKLILIFFEGKQLAGDCFNEPVICDKALVICGRLQMGSPGMTPSDFTSRPVEGCLKSL